MLSRERQALVQISRETTGGQWKYMEGSQFLRELAEAFAEELAPIQRLSRFTTNSAIIGAHAEIRVRTFVRRLMRPIHVSTGAVIDERLCSNPRNVPQIDTIFWWPGPAPAAFEQDDFAIVPRSSCYGILEIKRSIYSRAGEAMNRVLERANELVSDVRLTRDKKVVTPWLGIYCVDEGESDPPSRELVASGRALVLLKTEGDGWKTNHEGILQFVNFLVNVRTLAFGAVGMCNIDVNMLAAPSPHTDATNRQSG